MFTIVAVIISYLLSLSVLFLPMLVLAKKQDSGLLPPPPPPPSALSKNELERYESVELDLERKLENKLRKEEKKLMEERLKLLKKRILEREQLKRKKDREEKLKQDILMRKEAKKLLDEKRSQEKKQEAVERLRRLDKQESMRKAEQERKRKELEKQRIAQALAKEKEKELSKGKIKKKLLGVKHASLDVFSKFGHVRKEEEKKEERLLKQIREKERLKLLKEREREKIKLKLAEKLRKADELREKELEKKKGREEKLKQDILMKKEAKNLLEEKKKQEKKRILEQERLEKKKAEDIKKKAPKMKESHEELLRGKLKESKDRAKEKKRLHKKQRNTLLDIKKLLIPNYEYRVDVKRQRKELLDKLGKIRGIEKNRKIGLVMARGRNDDKKWLLGHRQKEIDKLKRIKELEKKEEGDKKEGLEKIKKKKEEKAAMDLERRKGKQGLKKEKHGLIRKEMQAWEKLRREALKENYKRVEIENRGREGQLKKEEEEMAKRKLLLEEEKKGKAEETELIADLKRSSLAVPDEVFAHELPESMPKEKKQLKFLRAIFKGGPVEIELNLEAKVDKGEPAAVVDKEMTKILKMLEAEQLGEGRRHKHEGIIEKRLAEKEKKEIEEEVKELTNFIIKDKMPKSERKKIKAEMNRLKNEAAELAKKVADERDKLESSDLEAEKEIQRAIQAIKHDKLTFKPREVILKKEHLIDKRSLYDDEEYILNRIADARGEMLRLNLNEARSIYIEIMDAYMKLKPLNQRRVHGEVVDLYNERKKAENLFMR
ncbi:MAG: hypothetical protein KAK00_06215 [Nanoarchaeota archaeon]|nr:hypothetical protein [Nanoarchaeota archaeon]